MKDPTYRAKCIDKVLSKHSTLEVISGLTDIALDIFQLSLKTKTKPCPKKKSNEKSRSSTNGKIRSKDVNMKNSRKRQEKDHYSKNCKSSSKKKERTDKTSNASSLRATVDST